MPRCWRSTAAARRPTSHSCAATARSWAPLASPARSAIERGRRGAISRMPSSCASTPPSTRPPSARGSIRLAVPWPMSGPSVSPARTCPPTTGGSSPGCASNGWVDRADLAQRHVRRAPGGDRPVVGGRRRLRVRHELCRRRAGRPVAGNRATRPSGATPAQFVPNPQTTATPHDRSVPARSTANVSLRKIGSVTQPFVRTQARSRRSSAGRSAPARQKVPTSARGRRAGSSPARSAAWSMAAWTRTSSASSRWPHVAHVRSPISPATRAAPRTVPSRRRSATSVLEPPPSTASSAARLTAAPRACRS